MKRKMLVADLLCGAGGSSTGAQRALAELGLEMELVCVNHWPTAIETHQKNHPEARHFVQDISTVRPHLIVPEGYLDLLMASPTCTHHSVARGGKPTSDQQRSDPWHIITWLTELRVKRIIIENVWEFIGWGPVNVRTGKPIASRKGEYFHAWIETIKRLGFEPEWRKLNAADYGDATTRQRFILMARSDGRRVHWPMPTHKKRDEVNADLFGTAKPWRPARDIIDWDIKGRSIFNRKKALAPKTLARIYAGAVKFGWPEPYLVILRNHMNAQGIDQPLPTLAANGMHIGLAEPVIVNMKGRSTASSSGEPLPTQTAHAQHLFSAEPIVLSQHNSGAARSAGDPLPTITTGGAASGERPGCARPMLIEPFVLSQASGGSPRGVENPIPTAPTGGAHALISPYYGSGSGETCNSVEETLPTITSKGRFGMVVPVTNSNGGAVARNIDTDPVPTMTTAKGGEFAFIAAQFGEREGQAPRVHDLGDPTPTLCATGRVNLVEPAPQYDILFRMLEPHELAAAMGFTTEEFTYEFAGTKTEQIKQIGNAVSVAKMKACVGAIMADAAPKRKTTAEQEYLEAAE
ncbi:DNA cytosine methyltransferase [Sinorhizobium meliloti]|nr:DNA cytosine methyltransferase [Sinorhizobium meliloti]MDW9846917.1 DNA cytosine methyltransferase [Sinorhizobium meliloti]MDX0143721.1 DNA cytosine methyltransferase [Sinorhizobium meliloti]MDX0149746.1 DNA cytosine methyltransferase [Sinorhizobium meliloti]MDX0168979.1 DNA cytosine methyltransferase [Sinorhizobium meliloti]